jgi:hypothetical protein
MGPVRSSPPSDRHAAELTLLSVRWFVPLMVVPAFLMLLIVARAFYAAFPDRDFLARRKSSVETLLIDGPAPESCNA